MRIMPGGIAGRRHGIFRTAHSTGSVCEAIGCALLLPAEAVKLSFATPLTDPIMI